MEKPKQVCDLCGSGSWRVFATKGRGGSSLTTVICNDCGLVYTNPRLEAGENAEFYHESYWGSYKNQSAPDEKFFQRRVPKIKEMVALLRPHLMPGVRVLEVGTSVGALLSGMKEAAGGDGQFTGIEPHGGHAKFAREKKGLDVHAGLLEEIAPQLSPDSFDLAVMNHVLEHTLSPTEVLLTVRSLLKRGGLFVIEVPNVEAPGSRLSHFFHHAHHYNFSPRTITRLAAKTGFAVQRVTALDGDLPGTRLFTILQKPETEAAHAPPLPPGDDPAQRAAALRRYERWYWLTAASLRKKFTHWLRQRS